uniref:Uncharacterized protein n=1 Tax=Anguilla anguilla TaxID=7936 RepID=A0A0E9VIA2_ANGAN
MHSSDKAVYPKEIFHTLSGVSI